MLFEGIMLGSMTTLGFCLMYGKLPPWVQEFMKNHTLVTEIACTVGFYLLMGMSLTSHVAVGVMILQVQGLLHMAKHPDDFLFVHAALADAKKKMSGLTDRIRAMNEEYKRTHAVEVVTQ